MSDKLNFASIIFLFLFPLLQNGCFIISDKPGTCIPSKLLPQQSVCSNGPRFYTGGDTPKMFPVWDSASLRAHCSVLRSLYSVTFCAVLKSG